MGEVEDLKSQRIVLRAEELCKETFAPFGQVHYLNTMDFV